LREHIGTVASYPSPAFIAKVSDHVRVGSKAAIVVRLLSARSRHL
jgi:hypothetical protein